MSETGDEFDLLRIPFEKIKFGNKLETQGYGTVFEGKFDDQRVALKQLNITNLANIKPKLLAEILTISRFRQHPNLVALLGFCDEKSNEIILVYEYVASGNLADKMRKRLNTIQRFEICLDAARGLDYLHTGVESATIVHGNIKPSKILLNSVANSKKFEAKVSSFGLSKIVPGKTLDSYDEVEKPTKESDVYSFGVVLLEVLCGVSELVDTDDYQERHVTELVPKKMVQNKLQKVVHFDIRKEIKPEALETYARIACQCVVEDPHARPQMAQVVEELEKALRLQGGEVTYVQLRGSGNIAPATVVDGSKGDGSEEDAKDVTVGEKSVDAGEVNGEVVNVIDAISKSSNVEKHTESVPSETHIEDAKIETSNDDQVIERELLHDLKFETESNIAVENEEVVHDKEIGTKDLETIEDTIDDFDSNKESYIIEENKEDDKSIEVTSTSEYNGDTNTLTNQEADDNILKLDIQDELEHLRIPCEKLKFGQKIDARGYGSTFEGEYNDRKVALKRLNITNLGNIKPKLLSAILTISRFREHPNLVALIGFCDENDKEIILVYEYVSGGNLADNMSKHLTTIQRLQICLGAARGVEYLHNGVESVDSIPGIIHGDLKLTKILLNPDSNSSNFDAKVSGFGLPKVFPGHVEISPKSMDPVYAATGKLTKESDVYTFGVLLLEVLCGVPELVDTDDYQERHVTELVPKRLEQSTLRKLVHFDIRNEITTESLETYAKIACRCVMKNPEERPTISEVVIELEKALRLQGGEATDVQIIGSSNDNGLAAGPVVEGDHEGDDNGETISSDITEEESKIVEETVDDTNLESEPVKTDIENAKNENSNGDQVTEREILIDLKSEKESNITVENEEVVHKEISAVDPETTEETIDEFDSNKESNIIEENKEDEKSIEVTSTSESNNGDTSTSTNQEVDESDILKSHIEDGLEHLRIPFKKIIFGQKIDVRGYGTLFKGEFNNQQVALKRLNITNLGNIKPKLLSAILTISKFREHPNLVALIGFCDENDKEIILVYEYVSGGNLADNMSKHLTTIQRLQICLGAARGVEYLHDGNESVDSKPVIIHGDLKLSKILLNPCSNSSNFDAKVSGFGLPKVFPGHVEISPKSMDPVHAATGKLTKESDVYTFGVLLLEVLCGVPELVDTDDYQERHVTEVVPKRLEQNMLRKIVHFDIRNEITTKSLETYAKIACKCVMKNPEERPTMFEVVVELEKALKLQGGKVSDVQIIGSSNGNGLAEVHVCEDDHACDDNGETMSSDVTEEESKVFEETVDDTNVLEESLHVPLTDSLDADSVPEDAETKSGGKNDPESIEEITLVLKSSEESEIGVENEASDECKINTMSSKSDNDNNSAHDEKIFDVQLVDSSNVNGLSGVSVGEDVQEGDDNGETVTSTITKEDSKVDAEKESGDVDNVNAPEDAEEITVNLKSTDEAKTNEGSEVNNKSKITTPSADSVMQEPLMDEKSEHEDATKEKGNGLLMSTNPHNKEIMEEQNSVIPDGDAKVGSLNTEKPELVVNIRGDFSDSVTQIKESKSKRCNSTCSESSNGDDTTPSDLLLPKTPDKVTKTSKGSRSCCSCSWLRYICSRVVFYAGLFWNKLVSCFNWMTGQCSSKKD